MDKKTTKRTSAPKVEEEVIMDETPIMTPTPTVEPSMWMRKNKNWTPLLMVVLVVASFFLGSLWTKVQYLEKGGTPTAGTDQQAQISQGPAKPVDVKQGKYPVLGKKDAKVRIVEFADFQCPFCEKFFTETEQQIIKDYVDTGKASFEFQDYPFLGQESTDAANAAQCANEQGKFWAFHDYLYKNQGQENSGTFSVANLKKFATTLGLDTAKFNACLDSNKYSADVNDDLKRGQAAGVNGTPAVFINGQIVVGAQPYSAFKTLIDQELAKK